MKFILFFLSFFLSFFIHCPLANNTYINSTLPIIPFYNVSLIIEDGICDYDDRKAFNEIDDLVLEPITLDPVDIYLPPYTYLDYDVWNYGQWQIKRI
jgi:hypothetical protein